MNSTPNQKSSDFPVETEIEKLAEAFLDLWQDNIQLCSKEHDLFTLNSLDEAIDAGESLESVPDER